MNRINDKLYLQYEKIMLENGMPQDLIFKTFKELLETNMFFNHTQQLQAYKDKEDKLREYCEVRLEIAKNDCVPARSFTLQDILQILNEGDDE